MATTTIIQHRRGNYVDFDPQKMKPAELAVVQSGDPISSDGKGVYVGIQAGDVKRLATMDDMADEINAVTDNIVEQVHEAADEILESVPQIQQNTSDIVALKADLSDVNERVDDIEPGLSNDAKIALLNCFRHVAWIDEHGQDYYDALEEALYESPYPRITATINQTGYVFDTDNIDSVKQYLTVKYFETEEDVGTVVTNYAVSGVLTVGISTVTIRYEGLSTTVNVTVSSYFFEPTFGIGTPSANNTSIGYSADSKRACNNPMAIKLPVGLYEIDNTSAGADYYYAISAYSYDDEEYDVNWHFTEGTSKTIIKQSTVPYTIKWSLYVDGSSGWMNTNGKQIRVTEQDTVIALNIKKYSAGTENISQNDLATLNNGGIVLRRISA